MDSSEFRFLLGVGVGPADEDIRTSADEAGSHDVEEDAFIADVVNSLASVQQDAEIMSYISFLEEEPATSHSLIQNNEAAHAASASAAAFSSQDWAKHRGELETLYSEDDLKLKDIMKIMRDKYNLSAGFVFSPFSILFLFPFLDREQGILDLALYTSTYANTPNMI